MTNVQNQASGSSSDEYLDFQIALQDSLGIVIGDDYRNRIQDRLQPVMLRQRLAKLSDLSSALRDGSRTGIRSEVLEAISIQDMAWFRYQDLNRLICDYVLPSLANKQQQSCSIWYPGCSTGHGAFSLAMMVAAKRAQSPLNIDVSIVATDSSQDSIDIARTCSFSDSDIEGMPENYQQRYLEQVDGVHKLDAAVCNMIEFKAVDLMTEAAQKQHFDIVYSPDVLMYFSTGSRKQILDDYAELLSPSGILLLNAGEMVLPYCDRFDMVEHDIATFYRQSS